MAKRIDDFPLGKVYDLKAFATNGAITSLAYACKIPDRLSHLDGKVGVLVERVVVMQQPARFVRKDKTAAHRPGSVDNRMLVAVVHAEGTDGFNGARQDVRRRVRPYGDESQIGEMVLLMHSAAEGHVLRKLGDALLHSCRKFRKMTLVDFTRIAFLFAAYAGGNTYDLAQHSKRPLNAHRRKRPMRHRYVTSGEKEVRHVARIEAAVRHGDRRPESAMVCARPERLREDPLVFGIGEMEVDVPRYDGGSVGELALFLQICFRQHVVSVHTMTFSLAAYRRHPGDCRVCPLVLVR